jgi:hypothetical protein
LKEGTASLERVVKYGIEVGGGQEIERITVPYDIERRKFGDR